MNINFGFGPGFISPEEMERQRQEQVAATKDAIANKQCIFCENAYLINDQVVMCSIEKRCVDGQNGQECEHWDLLEAFRDKN